MKSPTPPRAPPPAAAAAPSAHPLPPPHLYRTLLTLISLITIGSHYGKHSLSSLGPEIISTLHLRRSQFGLLFSSEQLPGIILPILGGLALTYVPHGPAAVFLSAAILLATSLCALAITHHSFALLFLGRFLFGLFDGALTTLQAALVAHWFRTTISSSFGVTLLVSRTSSFLGLSLPAFVSSRYGLPASMWFSVVACLPPFVASVVYTAVSRRYTVPSVQAASGEARPLFASRAAAEQETGNLRVMARVVRALRPEFWLICYIWVAVAGAVFSSVHFAPDAFSGHFGISSRLSGVLSGSIVIVGGLSSPAFGALQDRVGRRALIVGCACAMICAGVGVCAVAIAPGVEVGRLGSGGVVVGLGLMAGGVAAAPVTLMSSLALCVEDLGTAVAFGVYKAAENAGLAVLHVGTGVLRDAAGNYVASFVVLAGLAGSGVVAAVVLGRKAPVLRLGSAELAGVGVGVGAEAEGGDAGVV